jgi:WD40 repeat protein
LVSVFDLETGTQKAALTDLVDLETGDDPVAPAVAGLAFRPDGRYLAAARRSGASVVWDTSSWFVVAAPTPDRAGVTAAPAPAFDPTGTSLAVGAGDDAVRVLDGDTFQNRARIALSHPGNLANVAFSADGRFLAALVGEGVSIYDIESGRRIGAVMPAGSGTSIAVYGRQPTLATVHNRHIVAWNMDWDSWAGLACAAAGRNLTYAEWEAVGPRDRPYRPTCPQFGEPVPEHAPPMTLGLDG